MDTVRFGGVHTGLSGAVTRDLTGVRNQYTFNWEKLEQEDYDYLEACNAGLLPGDRYLINPLKKNRLSLRASVLNPGAVTRHALDAEYWSWTNQWPTEVTVRGRSVNWFSFDPAADKLHIDGWSRTPVFPGETITGSLYALKTANLSGDAGLAFRLYRNGVYDSTTTPDTTTLADDVFTRMTTTVTVPGGITSVVLEYTPPQTGSSTQGVVLAAPQVQSGDTATEFELGGGAPRVVIDQMTTASPRFGLYDVELNVLEA